MELAVAGDDQGQPGVDVLGAPHRVITVAGPIVDEEVGPVPDTDEVQACTRAQGRAAGLSLLSDL